MKIELRFLSPAVHIVQFCHPPKRINVPEDGDHVDQYTNSGLTKTTRLSTWFELNKANDVARSLAFGETPTRFVWNKTERKFYWVARSFCSGRIFFSTMFSFI